MPQQHQLKHTTTEIKVLLVDDDQWFRSTLHKALTRIGVGTVEEAANGNIAFRKMQAATPKYDLVVTDCVMSKGSGLDLIENIRSLDTTRKTPIILVTGEASSENITKAIKIGVEGIMTKPFRLETLTKKVQQAIDRH